MADRPSVWGEQDRTQLATLWASGDSINVIGRTMGRTRNAVSGAVRRMDLPLRGNPGGWPIMWDETDRARLATLWASGDSINVIGRTMGRTRNAVVGMARRLGLPLASGKPPVKAVTSVKAVPPVKTVTPEREPSNDNRCCYPIGTPRTPSFRYCAALARAGGPYCAPHHEITHTRSFYASGD